MKQVTPWAGRLAAGCIAAFPNPTIAAEPPIIRAQSDAIQEPLCYMDGLSIDRQNLDETCTIGKPKPLPPFDMTTDRDNNGIPDDVHDFLNRKGALTNAFFRGEFDEAKAAQMEQIYKEFADRSPLNTEQKAALTQVGQTFRDINRLSTPGDSPRIALKRHSNALDRFVSLMGKVEKTPFMQKMKEFSDRRDAKLMEKFQ